MALDWSRSSVTDGDLRVLAAFAHTFVPLEKLSLIGAAEVGRDGVVAVAGIASLTELPLSDPKRCWRGSIAVEAVIVSRSPLSPATRGHYHHAP